MEVRQQRQRPDTVPKPPRGGGKHTKADEEDETDSAPKQPKGKGKDIDEPDSFRRFRYEISVPEPSKGRRKRKKDEGEGEGKADGTRESLTAENYLQHVHFYHSYASDIWR
jgi:hypothetical protein